MVWDSGQKKITSEMGIDYKAKMFAKVGFPSVRGDVSWKRAVSLVNKKSLQGCSESRWM